MEENQEKTLQEQIDIAMKEKEEAIYNQEFERAATIRDKEKEMKEHLEKLLNNWRKQKNKERKK